jgi:gluconate kinase
MATSVWAERVSISAGLRVAFAAGDRLHAKAPMSKARRGRRVIRVFMLPPPAIKR